MAANAQGLSYVCVITMFEQLLSQRAVAHNSAPFDQEGSKQHNRNVRLFKVTARSYVLYLLPFIEDKESYIPPK
jgi:hypothetical protein